MTTTVTRSAPKFAEAIRRNLERPLASYQMVLGSSLLIVGLGLIMVLSSSSVLAHQVYDNSYAIVIRQALFALLGLVGGWIAATMPLSMVKKYATIGLIGATVLVGLTFVPGLGQEVNGNRNWLPLFAGFALQPSEFAKLGLVAWIATWYAQNQRKLTNAKAILVPVAPIAAFVTGLVVLQKDLGTALVLVGIVIGTLWSVGLPRKQMLMVGATIGVGLVFLVAIAPHRIARLLSFLNPMADPENAGYQSIHAMMALATGGFWGVGLGGSRQKWGTLPEAHTDFILAVVGEELGLFGTFVLLILFAVLIIGGIRVAMRTKDVFAHHLAVGITVWISAQAIINIGMVLGLLPVIGIPLPLMSYGGSSLLVTMVAIGLLVNCAMTEPGARRARAASRSARSKAAGRGPRLMRKG